MTPEPLEVTIDEPTLEDPTWMAAVTWAWGPQGHPASVRLCVLFYEEADGQTVLAVEQLGPLIQQPLEIKDLEIKDLEQRAEAIAALGERVEHYFGSRWDWWRCNPTCVGTISIGSGHYGTCPACANIRQHEERRAKQFLRGCSDTG